MTLSDSMFLFEIIVEGLKSYKLDCKEFTIEGKFAELFELNIYPGSFEVSGKQSHKSVKGGKTKVRRSNYPKVLPRERGKQLLSKQSIVLVNNAYWIIFNMIKYNFELSMWSKTDPKYKIGYVEIPWSKTYIDYLNNLNRKEAAPVVKGIYKVFDEITKQSVATITLSIKLTAFYKLTSQFKCIPDIKSNSLFHSLMDAKPVSVMSQVRQCYNNNQSGQYLIDNTILYRHQNKAKVTDLQRKNVIKNNVKVSSNKTNNKYRPNIVTPVITENFIDKSFAVIFNNKKQISSKIPTSVPKLDLKKEYNLSKYIFGCPSGYSNANKVYSIYYFTVDVDKSSAASNNTSKTSLGTNPSKNSTDQSKRIRLRKCKSECSHKKDTSRNSVGSCSSDLSLNLPHELADLVKVGKCNEVRCESKVHRKFPDPPDDAILLNFTNHKNKCCENGTENIEEIIGGVSAKMKVGNDPCFCTCECRFGFTKKTTYCGVCGGYEIAGEELARKTRHEMPFACPIFHKLVDKNKLKALSTSGSESKKKDDKNKTGSSQKAGASDKRLIDQKSVESEKDFNKSKRNKKDDRFKFNYGYKAPQIGHSKCVLPCTGTLGNVPKHMGWLWTAGDIPGLKFRPLWKPGAANKHVVRLLKIAKNPEESYAKKRRRDTGKKKRPLKRPLLIVHKKDGEFTVTMETMKTFTKPRAINQHPYEDKPVITYTIGRTEEENLDRRKKKERAQRRLERAQRHFIQDTFKDMCTEICLTTYQQALGILPEAEEARCMCYPALPTAKNTNLNISCSCSEDSSSIGSDTDSDEWIAEFTPPNALFDPTLKGKKVLKIDTSTQYTYLDYRIKLFDAFGNPVPRFFKGPDGKQQCSDLGGFWSADHTWLEINVDGFIAPDGRWAPNVFIGPNGEQIDTETGKFQQNNGEWLVVGVDGYVDSHGKWRFYPKKRGRVMQSKLLGDRKKNGTAYKKDEKFALRSEASWSCFGDVSPRQLSELGIIGHGQDKKTLGTILKDMLARGEDVKIPQTSTVFRLDQKSKKNVQTNTVRNTSRTFSKEKIKCRHPLPSNKGIIAVDEQGNKTYFKLRDHYNERPHQRLAALSSQGISLSSFHVPCIHSFINSEIMKQQQRDRLMKLANKNAALQS